MAYLNLDPDYFDHPKVARLRSLLGRDSDVLPVRLMCFCAKYFPATGALSGLSLEEIESRIGWRGEAGRAVKALMEAGILEHKDGGYQVHDWKKHQGHIDALKARASRAAKERWKKLRGNASSSAQAEGEQSPSRTVPPKPDKGLGENDSSQSEPGSPGRAPNGASQAGENPAARKLREEAEARRLKDMQNKLGTLRQTLDRFARDGMKPAEDMERMKGIAKYIVQNGGTLPGGLPSDFGK